MKAKRFLGFTLVELIASIAVILVLTGIVLAVTTSGKDAAKEIRGRDAAATLNEAERGFVIFATQSCPTLGCPAERQLVSDLSSETSKEARIQKLKELKLLANIVDHEIVQVTREDSGEFHWDPLP